MRAVVQRVSRAEVVVDGEVVGKIGHGLLVLLGVAQGDGPPQAVWMSEKVAGLRIFDDPDGKMNLSLADVDGEMLVVSQFTLLGDCRKGKRPSFIAAAAPGTAEGLYQQFVELVRQRGVTVATGRFQTHMEVSLTNDGPVTILIESPSA